MKKQLFTVAMLLSPFFADAQRPGGNGRSIIGLTAGATVTQLDATGFNEGIPDSYPDILNGTVLLSTFGFRLYVPQSTGLYAEVLLTGRSRNKEQSGVRLEEQLMNTEVSLCYRFLSNGHHKLDAGLGFTTGFWKAYYYADQPGQTFAGAAAAPAGERTFVARNMFSLQPKVGYRFGLDKNNLMLIGLDAGYRIGLGGKDWQLYGNKLTASPKQDLSGPFAAISLMIGY